MAAALQKNRMARLQYDFRAGEMRYDRNSQRQYFHDYIQHPPPIEALFDANEHADKRIRRS